MAAGSDGAGGDGSLDHSLVSGMAWTAALRWPAQAISWAATAYAARLLAPSDYGLVSMAMLGIGLVRMVEDLGLDAVLVQDRSIVGDRQARLAGFVLLAGALLSLLFVALAVPLAGFFGEQQVAPIVMLLSLLCVGDALQVVPRAALQREMRFARLAWAQFLQVVVTQGTLVLGATLGWGVWSLVFNTLAGSAAVTALLLWWHPFPVRPPRGLASLSRPLLQGWRVLASRIAYYGYSNADQLVVGKLLGKEALGAYSFATTLSTTLTQEIASVVSKVVPGILSAVQTDPLQLRRYFLLLTELVALVTLPMSAGIALTADEVVRLVLGPQWEAVVTPLRWLCLYAAFYTSQLLVGPVLLWTGQFRANMWCSVLAGIGLPLAFLAGAQEGLPGVALAWVLVFPLVNIPAMRIAFRTMDSGLLDWLRALLPAGMSCAVMAVALHLLRPQLPSEWPLGATTAALVAAGVASYVIAILSMFRRRVATQWAFLQALRQRGDAIA